MITAQMSKKTDYSVDDSRWAKASFIVAISSILTCALTPYILELVNPANLSADSLTMIFFSFITKLSLWLSSIGIILGILGMVEKNKSRLLSGAGMIFNILIVVILVRWVL